MNESLSVVVMAYNEAATLAAVVRETVTALDATGRRYELIVIDDGSTDATGGIADDLAAQIGQARAIHHPRNLGMGGVYRTAFGAVQNDIVYFMAADGQPIPSLYFDQFLPLLTDADIVIGRLPHRQDPWLSRFLSWSERQLFRLLAPGVPKLEGPLMFRRRLLQEVTLATMQGQDRSWIILWELLAKAKRQGATIVQVDTRRRPRRCGRSKGSTWRNAWSMTRAAATLGKILKNS